MRWWIGLVMLPVLANCTTSEQQPGGDGSPGCEDGTLDETVTHVELEAGGVSRSYELHVPPRYEGSTPFPLILSFHGYFLDGTIQQQISSMDAIADERGYLVAYPNGLDKSWNAGDCCGDSAVEGVDDVGFARAVIDDMAERGCIDRSRVYAAGFSNGGFLSHRLACEASDVIAAIGPVAGVLGIDASECTPERAVPIIHFHGTGDIVVQYDGGCDLCVRDSQSVADTMAVWAERYGCSDESEGILQSGTATCETAIGCEDDVELTLCTVEDGQHCWFGAPNCPFGEPGSGLSANALMLDLFDRVQLP